MSKQLSFFGLLITAAILSELPIIGIPFNWLETFFHEASHALATVATGGSVQSMQLEPNGAGLVMSLGGWKPVIAFSGYAGAALWGSAILIVAASPRMAKPICAVVLLLLLTSLVFWSRDLLTLLIVLGLMLLFCLPLRWQSHQTLGLILQLVGMTVLLNALKSPWVLLLPGTQGDAHLLAQLTLIPAFVWVIIWFGLALWCLYRSWLRLTKVRRTT
ncbi:M50 family metallopeptidase [Paraferrimonas sedimenticola]|uniref:Membrane zinc metalloprotease n=1 Tax=Paraferrimonas sedimenticola TaxID=375674 RepID=A0AA37W166_9GAMM|nr:M50 family metallopeptidase [Paraferrimonas sedimenticola]GLP96508.1 membrane zinc metalloprotease [Paraferrimonas sedimenticola]